MRIRFCDVLKGNATEAVSMPDLVDWETGGGSGEGASAADEDSEMSWISD